MLDMLRDRDRGRTPRAAERSEVRLDATIAAGGMPAAIRIGNLSTRGFMAECAMVGLAGRRVRVALPGRPPIDARILWGVAGRIGGIFLPPLAEAECARLRATGRA